MVLLYLHGGLNSESASAKRIVAMRDVMLENEIYPLHIMWESDFLSSVAGMFEDLCTEADKLAGGGFLENLTEAKDRVLELTLARAGFKMWGEMKENAQLASEHPHNQGAIQLVAHYVELAKKKLASHDKAGWELHIVGHSAGSIFAAHAMPLAVEPGHSAQERAVHGACHPHRHLQAVAAARPGSGAHPAAQPVYAVGQAGTRRQRSTQIPYTSESKEAIADVEEIENEIKLAFREVARKVQMHINKKVRRVKTREKFDLITKILPEIAKKSAHMLNKPVPSLEKVITRIMDVV